MSFKNGNGQGYTSAAAGSPASSSNVGERELESVPRPLWECLPSSECLDDAKRPKIGNIVLHFLRQGRLRVDDAVFIAQQAAVALRAEPNVLELTAPLTVVGDICGQLYDLAKVLSLGGELGQTKYLFLGNYIGCTGFSSECLLLLLAAKAAFPQSVYLLRGNHECAFVSKLIGFEAECLRKYSEQMFNACMAACNCLPLAAIVAEKFFCVHGGLSPGISKIGDIQLINRFREVPTKGAMCDLLWSDPYWDVQNPVTPGSTQTDYYTPGTGSFATEPTFYSNEQRGCSYLFNFACVKHFANLNKLLCVIRSNEMQDDGYKLYRPHPNNNFPIMATVFSAPNYCDMFDNKGSILLLTEDNMNFIQFFCAPRPFELQELNGISWSLPFMLENLTSIFSSLAFSPIGESTQSQSSAEQE